MIFCDFCIGDPSKGLLRGVLSLWPNWLSSIRWVRSYGCSMRQTSLFQKKNRHFVQLSFNYANLGRTGCVVADERPGLEYVCVCVYFCVFKADTKRSNQTDERKINTNLFFSFLTKRQESSYQWVLSISSPLYLFHHFGYQTERCVLHVVYLLPCKHCDMAKWGFHQIPALTHSFSL